MKSLAIRSWTILLFVLILFSACSPDRLDHKFKIKSTYSLNGEFEISVKLPSHYFETDKDYPVFYMTDADWFYGMAADMAYMMELGGHDFILVGIGYGDKASCREKRMKDLGSDLNTDGIPAYTLYQSFLKEELFPKIESRYRALSTNRTYFGWSLGALFANHMLYEQRDLFDNYILGGGRFPLDWSEHMKNSVKQPRNDRPLSLYVGFPGRDAPQEVYINMLRSLKEEDLADLFLHWDIYPDQGHDIESTADVLWKGMTYTFSPKGFNAALMGRIERDGLAAALTTFENWKTLRPELADFSPILLLSFGRYLNENDRQTLTAYVNQHYPSKTIRFHLNSKTVPPGSAVHITGNQPGLGSWDPAAVAMKQFPDGHWEKSIGVLNGTPLEYKFTLGSWDTEALDAKGQTLPNFKLSVEKDTVISVVIPQWKKGN